MISLLVLLFSLSLILLVMTVMARSIIKKQQLFGRPPIPVFFFILAKMLVIVNLVFLVLKGLDIQVPRIFEPPLWKIRKAIVMHPTFFNEKVYREKGFRESMEKILDNWSLKYPGIQAVDHIYFHSILAVDDATRKKYLEIAYLKGRELA